MATGGGRPARGRPATTGTAPARAWCASACVRHPDLGIGILTLYAFSANNWNRPESEVRLLLRLFERYLYDELEECVANGVRLQVIGRRDRLAPSLLGAIDAAERVTRAGEKLLLRVAIDYSARHAILAAAERLRLRQRPADTDAEAGGDGEKSRAAFGQLVAGGPVGGRDLREVDLIIRTGGEQRLSDFLLWEGAYAELYFTNLMWPEFGREQLSAAIAEFHHRERRYGCLPEPAPEPVSGAARGPEPNPVPGPVAEPMLPAGNGVRQPAHHAAHVVVAAPG